jgi:hypothetical protein
MDNSFLIHYVDEMFDTQLPDNIPIKQLMLERQHTISIYSFREKLFKENNEPKGFWHPDLIKNLMESDEENFVLHMIQSDEKIVIIFTGINATKIFGYIGNIEPIKK